MIDEKLLATFGYDSFRPGQREMVEAALAGRDALGVMPTGSGKSLCYMLPATMMAGVTVVVTPLISLMQDQVRAAREHGICAYALHHATTATETDALFSDRRKVMLLYVSPERLQSMRFRMALRGFRVSAFVVDEAHLVAEWGAEFRPDYHRIREATDNYDAPVAAYTATATADTKREICERLGLKSPAMVQTSFDRPNLRYAVVRKWSDGIEQTIEHAEAFGAGNGIIYRTTRADVERTCRKLRLAGIDCRAYHAGLGQELRHRHQDEFLSGDAHVMVATIAFGMGIDKPDVRWVLHVDVPKNIEGYYQETGRAGRDGQHADCTWLYSPGDIPTTRRFIDRMANAGGRKKAYQQMVELLHMATLKKCRRKQILAYFGEEYTGNCRMCDVCGY